MPYGARLLADLSVLDPMAGASVDCVGNLDLSSGEATAVFFAEHSTNTGNTAR